VKNRQSSDTGKKIKPSAGSHLPVLARRFAVPGGILFIGFCLRMWQITWGLPDLFEEAYPFKIAWKMWNWGKSGFDFNPHFFNYPALSFYLNFVLQAVQFLFGSVIGAYSGLESFRKAYEADPTIFITLSRCVSVGFDLGTIFVVFILGNEFANRRVGAIASILTAINLLFIKQAHLVNVDAPLTFFVVLSLLWMLRIYRTDETKWYFLTGLSIGLAAASKYNGALLAPVLICVHLAKCKTLKDILTSLLQPRLLWSIILSGAVFIAINPYILLDFPSFYQGFSFEESHMAQGHLGVDPSIGTMQFYLFHMLPAYLGWAMTISLALSLVWFFYRWERKNLVIILFPLLFLAILFTWKMRAERYLLPVMPPFLLVFSLGVDSFWNFIESRVGRSAGEDKSKNGFPAWIGVAAIGIVLLFEPMKSTFRYYQSFSQPDTRVVAENWIKEHVPAGSHIGMIAFGLKLQEPFTPFMIPFYPQDPKRMMPYYDTRWYSDLDIVVGTDFDYTRFLQDTVRFRQCIDYYRTLNTKWTKVFEIQPEEDQSGPAVWIYRLPDSLRTTTFDEELFQKQAAANDPGTASLFLKQLLPILRQKREITKAEQVVRNIITMEPNDAEARKFHAIVLDNQGKPEEALKEINNCIALNPNQPDAYFLQGKALERLNMANDAITSFSRVISMDRSFEASYDELAKLYMQAGDASKAAAVLSAHLAMLNPASPKAKELAMEIERLKRSR
jgi:hypothetical protein